MRRLADEGLTIPALEDRAVIHPVDAAAVADYFWIEPARSFAIASPLDGLSILIFVLNCISWIVELLQETQARVRGLEADRRAELERLVTERTVELGLVRNEAEAAMEAKTRLLAAATATGAELQAVLDAVPAGIWIARDPSYRTVQANRLATSWMRIPEGANLMPAETDEEHLEICWRETGGPAVIPPLQTGLGSTVISEMVEMNLDADVDLDFAPDGLIWRLRCARSKILESSVAA